MIDVSMIKNRVLEINVNGMLGLRLHLTLKIYDLILTLEKFNCD